MDFASESPEVTRVWKALGDPTRRRLLEMLREGPKTTGELSEHFAMTRYGVMNHLDILEAAGLLVAKREGRKRFNHVNAVPLQRLVRRFVRGFAEADASRLLNLERHLDASQTNESNAMSENTNRNFHIVQEIIFAASGEKIWSALTRDVGQWWSYHIGPNDSAISLEGCIGGLFIERWGDGEGELYATVTFMKKGTKLTLEGGMGMSGPGVSKYSFGLEECDGGTKLTLNHYCHGYRTEDTEASYRGGWDELLTKNLKRWVEEGVPTPAA